jgi:hypothetical protein
MIKRGATREVFIFKRFVVKIPSFRSWRLFLHGILANLQEKTFSGAHPMLMPVLFCLAGFILVMPKCEQVFEQEELLLIEALDKQKNDDWYGFLESDFKPMNFGIYNGQVVKIDYGD